MNEPLTNRKRTPSYRDKRDPIWRTNALDQDIARELEDNVPDEEEEESDGNSVVDVEAEVFV